MTDTTEVEKWRPAHGGDAWVRVTDYDALAAKLADAERVARYETDIAQQALDQIKAEKARAESAEAKLAWFEVERDKWYKRAMEMDTHPHSRRTDGAYSDRREGMTDELKPCPFCGGKATYAKAARSWKVECEGRMGSCTMNARTHYQPHKFLAIAAWNTRAALSALEENK